MITVFRNMKLTYVIMLLMISVVTFKILVKYLKKLSVIFRVIFFIMCRNFNLLYRRRRNFYFSKCDGRIKYLGILQRYLKQNELLFRICPNKNIVCINISKYTNVIEIKWLQTQKIQDIFQGTGLSKRQMMKSTSLK